MKGNDNVKQKSVIRLTQGQSALVIGDHQKDIQVYVPQADRTSPHSSIILAAIAMTLSGKLPSSSKIIDEMISEFTAQHKDHIHG